MSKAEQRLQTAIVKYIRLAYPNTLFTATMGGVKLNSWSQRNALKATGYLKGVADLLIFETKGMYKGLFIEVKTETGRMTKEQKQFQTNATARGYLCVCCKGFDETKEILDDYLK
jgi:hypothetical protein|tara:strand:+ start:554 stop:898 length:345 start_codon:yes stop_codon:yes gene_type:complete